MFVLVPSPTPSLILLLFALFSPAVGNFFGYSCVPGVKDPKHDPRGNNPKNLCEACIGDENDRHICANNHRERHYGEAGALRYDAVEPLGGRVAVNPFPTFVGLSVDDM